MLTKVENNQNNPSVICILEYLIKQLKILIFYSRFLATKLLTKFNLKNKLLLNKQSVYIIYIYIYIIYTNTHRKIKKFQLTRSSKVVQERNLFATLVVSLK